MIDMGHAHLDDDTLAGLAERRLPPDRIAGALQHLEACSACRARAAAYAPPAGDVRGAFVDVALEHLDDEDLIAYVDGVARPDQIEIVETHVEDCALCRARRDDLLALRPPRPRDLRWIAIAASILLVAVLLAIFGMTRRQPHEIPQVTPQLTSLPEPPAPPPTADAHPEWTRLVAETVRSGQLPFPAVLATLAGETDRVRGTGTQNDGERVTPAGVVLDTPRPEFHWTAEGGSPVVVIYDGETEIARNPPLRTGSWTPAHDLPRGRTYAWQLEITKNGEIDYVPSPPALFRIASEEEHRQIEEAHRARPADHLLHAVLYARAGLRAEALASLRMADNPDARKILVRYDKP